MILDLRNGRLTVDFERGSIESLFIGGIERVACRLPLFNVRLRNREGGSVTVGAYDAGSCSLFEGGAEYSSFDRAVERVSVLLEERCGEAEWRIKVVPSDGDFCIESVDFPLINLPELCDNNALGGGAVLYPYNEGALITDMDVRDGSGFGHADAEYPSKGKYSVFPNMICSQMLAYLWDDAGLYVGAHDGARGVKEIDFYSEGEGVTFRFRLFCGCDFGETFATDYPIVFSVVEGAWESAAERYRVWLEQNLPDGAVKIAENPRLPEWYADSPLVVTYPVRGRHDTDEMVPNEAFYPYTNALPLLDGIRSACDSRLLVLLMHWEGTAPWAPPYVWPPFGGEDNFNEFMRALHERGDMLGVYCSGFGYTLQSNVIPDYSRQEEYDRRELWRGMCADVDGEVGISNICRAQRSGYDICPASELGRSILDEAYAPLLESGVDYIQILDQNHGGGQYFCYSREHGHPHTPGAWMTESMQGMLGDWQRKAGATLLGCESAAAEPFIGNLLFSDNRYELNYRYGRPVPLYAYLYHEYLRNFMGNQVACPLPENDESILYRLAYSFSSGDCMTLILGYNGEVASHWGSRSFSFAADKDKIFSFVSRLSRFYRDEARELLYSGRMIAPPPVECESLSFTVKEREVTLPAILCTAWANPFLLVLLLQKFGG